MHQRNFINIYCFLVPSFNALLLNGSMHFNSHHLFQFSPCVFYPQYSVPTQLSPELWWADLTPANRAAGREWQLRAGDNKTVLEGAWGSFWFRNNTEVKINLSKDWLSIHLHTVSGLLSTSQASLCFYKQGCKFRNGQCLFLTKSQTVFLIPICWHFTQFSLNANHYLFHNWKKYKRFSALFYTKRFDLDDFCW